MKTASSLLLAALLAARAFSAQAENPAASLAREAKAQFDAGNFLEAKSIYEKAAVQTPANPDLFSELGVACFRANQLEPAREAFKKAIALEPADSFNHCALGIVHWSEGKYDDAVNKLTKALSMDPKNATAHYYLGLVAGRKNWAEAAQKERETAERLDPRYKDAGPRQLPFLENFLTRDERLKFPVRK